MPLSGIYQILNTQNGKFYVGHTRDFKRRQATHLCYLKRGDHHSPHLQNAWNKYGAESFKFQMIDPCDDETMLVPLEQSYLDDPSLEGMLYNLSDDARHSGTPSETTRQKMSESAKKRPPRSPETQEKMRQAMLGKKMPPRTEEMRQRAREKTLALWQDPGFRERFTKGYRSADPEKQSQAQKKRWQDPEHRQHMSNAHKGLKHTPESNAKRSESMKARFKDPAEIERVRRASQARWAKRNVATNADAKS